MSYVERVNLAIDHVMSHLAEPLRLERVARAAGLSPFHFHRVFQSLVGETLADFVKRLRLEKALYMMSHSRRLSLTAVALECGFSSSSDFSRCFRQRFGVPPSAFDDNRAAWGLVLAQTYALRGDRARSRAYADTARRAYEVQLEGFENAEIRALYGVALAYAGQRAEAVREGERAVALGPTRDEGSLTRAYVQHQLVRIYLLAGEPEKALDRLEPLLRIPYYLSPGWLRIDPNFDPLRGNARFRRLAAGS